MKTSVIAPVFALALIVASVAATRGDEVSSSLFCTLKSVDGRIYTVGLRVPKVGGGACSVVNVSLTDLSGPASPPQAVSHIVITSRTYSTNSTIPPTPNESAVPAAPSGGTAPTAPNPTYTAPSTAPSAMPFPPGVVWPYSAHDQLAKMALKDLGTITTTHGTAYTDCRLLIFQKDGVIVVSTGGVLKILLADLDAVSRQRVEAMR